MAVPRFSGYSDIRVCVTFIYRTTIAKFRHQDGHQKGTEKEEDQKQHGGTPSKMKYRKEDTPGAQ